MIESGRSARVEIVNGSFLALSGSVWRNLDVVSAAWRAAGIAPFAWRSSFGPCATGPGVRRLAPRDRARVSDRADDARHAAHATRSALRGLVGALFESFLRGVARRRRRRRRRLANEGARVELDLGEALLGGPVVRFRAMRAWADWYRKTANPKAASVGEGAPSSLSRGQVRRRPPPTRCAV